MPGKAKFQKHSAASLEKKAKDAKNKAGAAGGGGKLANARKNHAAKVSVNCTICKTQIFNMTKLIEHYDAKHAKIKFEGDIKAGYEAQFAGAKA
mmetsp:Transcript_21949/g.43599  ORF Transcript_21949/g.43599 Transcript_21949/m.43599 type:complete len:94 (+) Transcript_21949:30-311(+)